MRWFSNKIPLILIWFGSLVAILSILADFIGLGQGGRIPAVQILGAEAGAVLALTGLWMAIRRQNEDWRPSGFWRALADRILDQPVTTWVLAGFLIAYLAFFIFPTFLNTKNQFQPAAAYLPPRERIGFDVRLSLEHIRVWFTGEREPKYVFPALTTILFTPLLLLGYPLDYFVVTALTLVSYLVLNLFLPLKIMSKENRLLLFFIFGVSIFSYGLQFELETGQFYTITMALVLAAIYIFHEYPSYRIFAYILFSIAVQFKVFPAIFVVMFVDDWRDWKGIIKRFAVLGAVNFALLFLLGLSYFSLFFAHLVDSGAAAELGYNHSIYAIVAGLSAPNWVGALLYAYFALCFILVLRKAYLQNEKGIDASLLMVCLLGGLMIPAISHDYTLPLLTAPFVLVMSAQNLRDEGWVKLVSILLISAASFAYSATLFPSTARPVYLENSYLFLVVLLTAIVLLGFIQQESKPAH